MPVQVERDAHLGADVVRVLGPFARRRGGVAVAQELRDGAAPKELRGEGLGQGSRRVRLGGPAGPGPAGVVGAVTGVDRDARAGQARLVPRHRLGLPDHRAGDGALLRPEPLQRQYSQRLSRGPRVDRVILGTI